MLYAAPKIIKDKDRVIEFSIAKPKSAPKPIPKPLPPPPQRNPEKKPTTKTKPPEQKLPAPNQSSPKTVPEPPEKPKPVFGVNMASIVAANGGDSLSFAVPVGNTLMKEPEKKPPPLDEVKPLAYNAPKREFAPVPAHKLSQPPQVEHIVKLPYPDGELKRGIQGTVILQVAIDEEGMVKWAKVLSGVSPKLDELAKEALFKSRFKPALKDGIPVATVITFKYNWEIVE